MKRWIKRFSDRKAIDVAIQQECIDHQGLGDAARDSQAWTEAERHYVLHLAVNPRDFGIWVQLGHMLKEQRKISEAEHAYSQANNINGRDADLWLNRGHLAKLCQKYPIAQEYYLQSYSIDGNYRALNELNRLGVNTAGLPIEGSTVMDATRGSFEVEPVIGKTVGRVQNYDGSVLRGWVSDSTVSDTPPVVEILKEETVIAQGDCSLEARDLNSEKPATGASGFAIGLGDKVVAGDVVTVRLKETLDTLDNSPFKIERTIEACRWLERHQHLTDNSLNQIKSSFARETNGLKLSIVMYVDSNDISCVKRSVESVIKQWCSNWEMLIVWSPCCDNQLSKILQDYSSIDSRIQNLDLHLCHSRTAALNEAISLTEGDFTVIMTSDDVLEPEAVFRFLDTGKRCSADLIYCDEIRTSKDIDDPVNFIVRTSFSYDHYLSYPYLGRILCFRTNALRIVGGFDSSDESASGLSLVLRIIEKSQYIAHIPAFLYRTRRSYIGNGIFHPDNCDHSNIRYLEEHLQRTGQTASADFGLISGTYKINYQDHKDRVLIIIPTRDRIDLLEPCLESIWSTTNSEEVEIIVVDNDSHEARSKAFFRRIKKRLKVVSYKGAFNYAKMNNEIASKFGRGFNYIVFMNNDISAIDVGWLERMRSLAGRADVGVVGATLLYDDRRIQHSGVVLGVGGPVTHAHKFLPFEVDGVRSAGPNASLVSTRDYLAVTGACMLVKAELFFGVGGFDEEFVVDFNDIDLCLRIGSLGYKILNDPYSVMFHYESATRKESAEVGFHAETALFLRRWSNLLAQGDPYYSPLLSIVRDHEVGRLNEVYHPARVTATRPWLRPVCEGVATRVTTPVYYPSVRTAPNGT